MHAANHAQDASQRPAGHWHGDYWHATPVDSAPGSHLQVNEDCATCDLIATLVAMQTDVATTIYTAHSGIYATLPEDQYIAVPSTGLSARAPPTAAALA